MNHQFPEGLGERLRMTNIISVATVVHCADFSIQKYLDPWLQNRFGYNNFDRISLFGGILDFDSVLNQIKSAKQSHEIKQLVLISHEGCGAYGEEGSFSRHEADLEEVKEKLKTLFPSVDIEIYFLHLDGTFEKIS